MTSKMTGVKCLRMTEMERISDINSVSFQYAWIWMAPSVIEIVHGIVMCCITGHLLVIVSWSKQTSIVPNSANFVYFCNFSYCVIWLIGKLCCFTSKYKQQFTLILTYFVSLIFPQNSVFSAGGKCPHAPLTSVLPLAKCDMRMYSYWHKIQIILIYLKQMLLF